MGYFNGYTAKDVSRITEAADRKDDRQEDTLNIIFFPLLQIKFRERGHQRWRKALREERQ